MTTIEIKKWFSVFLIAFCVIFGPENVYLDTNIFFVYLDTNIFFSISIRNWDIKAFIF